MRTGLFVVLIIFWMEPNATQYLQAQGVRGSVVSEQGSPLPFASLLIRNTGEGAPANELGIFEIRLAPGRYDIVAQFLGYATEVKTVEVPPSGWATVDFSLAEQTYALREVVVSNKQEDPALTIMRKAIAKAKFHRLQVQEYTFIAYIKGTGQLTNIPFLLKKEMEKDGIKANEAYTSESVSRLTFRQPNYVEETVISIRSQGESNQTSPAPYIGASFYQPKINEAISPLAPAAFAYYRFRYEGSYLEEGVVVNRIRVTPRSRGERVFEGYIHIIEDVWSIHSLDLRTSLLGFQIDVKQLYRPVAEGVWMPATHTYRFSGKFFGFAGEYHYLASTSDYEVTLNPDLATEPTLIDEKIDQVPDDIQKMDRKASAIDQLAEADKMTRKEFRKLVNAYEKESLKEQENPEVTTERHYSIDSLASKRSLTYWDSIRPVKLTEAEIRGYRRDDSLAVIEAAKLAKEDSVSAKAKRKFSPFDILSGGRYHFGNGRSAGFHNNISRFSFNTVEGFKVGLAGFYRMEKSEKMADSTTVLRKSWNFRPEIRYGFGSEQLYGTLDVRRAITQGRKGMTFGITGGSYVFQFNRDNPISEHVNMAYSLLLRQNYMKLYAQDFVEAYFFHRLHDGITYRSKFTYAERRSLENQSNYSWHSDTRRTFSDNRPENIEATAGAFDRHRALLWQNSVEWRPGLKYRIRNGRKYPLYGSAPLVNLSYTKAFPRGDRLTTASFDWVEANIEHGIDLGVSGKLHFNLTAGTFIQEENVFFADYKHFSGNRTLFANMGVTSHYRFMDYYLYSTKSHYVGGIVHYQFRKFLFTQLPMLRYSGLRENVFVNYLKTANSPHYWELGYSLDNLFRIFRVETGVGFENRNPLRGGMRFGIASFINISMND
ncbi:MAG: carboxypeptidase-like regulatory domain-containing protein [Lunatimonas sp.]|nr:carboxypeptidase-like regulatory domain-containing protein [Lunatimonas sp.]